MSQPVYIIARQIGALWTGDSGYQRKPQQVSDGLSEWDHVCGPIQSTLNQKPLRDQLPVQKREKSQEICGQRTQLLDLLEYGVVGGEDALRHTFLLFSVPGPVVLELSANVIKLLHTETRFVRPG